MFYFICLSFDSIFSKIILVNSGDIEANPGRRKSSSIKFCHWNLNGLTAHDFVKVPLMEAFINIHNFHILYFSETALDSTIVLNNRNINIDNFHILYFSETALDSTIVLNNRNINIDRYSILRADHPSNNKRRSVCIYFKQLPLIRRDDLSTMQEALVTEISVESETFFFTCFYRSPSQIHDDLKNFY